MLSGFSNVKHWMVTCNTFLTFSRLNYAVLRPAIVYGLGDRQGLSMYRYSLNMALLLA